MDALTVIGPHSVSAPDGPDQIPTPANAPALAGWCTEIAEWRSEPEPPAWYTHRALWLRERLEWMCDAFPSVPGVARDVASADRALARATDESVTRHPIGRCTRAHEGTVCGQRLAASVWDKSVSCPRCESAWPRREWRLLATEMSKGAAA